MTIGIDISQVIYKGTGVARFTQGLVKAICDFDKKNEWVFFFSHLRSPVPYDIKQIILSRKFRLIEQKIPPMALSFLWNTLHIVPIEKFTGSLDWFITSDWTEPSSSCKKATIVHDLVFLRYPETVDALIKKTQKKRLRLVKKESTIIFSDSNATKKDLIELLHMEKDRVRTIYPGVEIKKSASADSEKILQKLNIQKPFILTVGKVEPSKNIERLIQAFKKVGNDQIDLVIVGEKGWGKTIQSQKNVRLLGYVPDEELYTLYRSCLFFVYPSIWEGFGYPVLEAMSVGAPVATSKTSSLEEIVQDAGLLFDPFSVDDIADVIHTLITNQHLRNELKQKGIKRSQIFTWANYYNEMMEILQNKSEF